MAEIGPVSGAGGSGWVKVADLDAASGVGNKSWQDAAETILQSADIYGLTVDVTVRSSFPKVTVDGNPFELPASADEGHYEGTVQVTLAGSGTVTVQTTSPDDQPGATDDFGVTYVAPPEILDVTFTGGYPGSQSELKAGDTFQLTGTTDSNADAIDIVDYGAMDNSLEVIAEGTNFTITGTIADRGTTIQHLAARVRARHPTTGAFGGTRDTDAGGVVDGVNRVYLNNLYPSVVYDSIDYPLGPPAQSALKGAEQAAVNVTVQNANTVLYSSPTNELSITNPSVNEPAKVVQRIAGTYNVSTNNLRCVATRTANDASATFNTVVAIADALPTIDIVPPAARLRSGGNDGTAVQDHAIQVQSDQQLLSVSLDADAGGGTLQGAGWTGGPTTWTRDLRVHDDDVKGSYSWQNLSAYNLAGQEQTVINSGSSYVLGGFVARDVVFSAFSQTSTINVAVVDYSKLTAGTFSQTGNPSVRNPVQGNLDDLPETYTVTAIGANPTTVFWNDLFQANANSGPPLAQLNQLEETV